MNIDDAVKRFQKEWNSYEYARLQKEYDEWRLNKWRGWQSLVKKN